MQKSQENINLNIYYQNESLLFQFILSEFLSAYQCINQIEEVYSHLETKLIKNRLQADVGGPLSEILDLLLPLTGAHVVSSYEQIFSWTHGKGSLNKLRHYCFLFPQKCSQVEAADMNVTVSKAFHSALQSREVILTLQQQIIENKIPNYIVLYQLLDKLIDNMRLSSRSILKLLIFYKEDENVLHFLIKNHMKFDEVYKTEFVSKVLKKMYPEGIKYVKDLIVEKYAKRGFGSLIETISKHIVQLEYSKNIN